MNAAQWRSQIESELGAVGVAVIPTQRDPARTYLVATVTALPTTSRGLAYYLQLSIRDVVTRSGNEAVRDFYAYTWQTGGIATVASDDANRHLTSFMTDFLDEFLSAYRFANSEP